MRYRGMVIRPPSEAESYILQVTYGCSHNRCAFCGTYLDKPFRTRPMPEILEDVARAGQLLPDTRRVFLADGNAMVLGTEKLFEILDALAAAFPLLRRVGIYANAQDLLRKGDGDLARLRARNLELVYIGLESGSEAVLRQIEKGSTARQMTDAVLKTRAAGIRVSVIALLGVAGSALSAEHAAETARVVREMDPEYLSLLTLMLVPGTELHRRHAAGEFPTLDPLDLLGEMRAILHGAQGLTRCVFRTNHASNYLPLAGTLSRDRDRLIATIDDALARGPSVLRPEHWRAL